MDQDQKSSSLPVTSEVFSPNALEPKIAFPLEAKHPSSGETHLEGEVAFVAQPNQHVQQAPLPDEEPKNASDQEADEQTPRSRALLVLCIIIVVVLLLLILTSTPGLLIFGL